MHSTSAAAVRAAAVAAAFAAVLAASQSSAQRRLQRHRPSLPTKRPVSFPSSRVRWSPKTVFAPRRKSAPTRSVGRKPATPIKDRASSPSTSPSISPAQYLRLSRRLSPPIGTADIRTSRAISISTTRARIAARRNPPASPSAFGNILLNVVVTGGTGRFPASGGRTYRLRGFAPTGTCPLSCHRRIRWVEPAR